MIFKVTSNPFYVSEQVRIETAKCQCVRSLELLTFVITAGCFTFSFRALFADYHYYSNLIKLVNLYSRVNTLHVYHAMKKTVLFRVSFPFPWKHCGQLSKYLTSGQDRIPIVISSHFFYLKHIGRKQKRENKIMLECLSISARCWGGVREEPAVSCVSFLQEYAALFPLLTASPTDTRWWRVNCEVHCVFMGFMFLETVNCSVWSRAVCTGFGPWSVFGSML